jgi:hypothetical protein
MSEKVTSYNKALTWRSFLALVFACTVLQPAIMYQYLITGGGLPFSSWLVILLWVELGRLLGNPLRKEEVFIINAFELTAINWAWLFIYPLKNLYYTLSPITEQFGFATLIPSWWSPVGESANHLIDIRTFLHPAWTIPILVMIGAAALTLIANISIGYLCYQLYVVTEKLAFPTQSASALTIVIVAEGKPVERVRVLMMSALLGASYAFLSLMLPSLAPLLRFLPRGTLDLTYLLDSPLPGSSFGIDLTLFTIVTGFIIDIRYLAAQFASSIAVYVIGNHFLIKKEYGGLGIWEEWKPGMALSVIYSRSGLYFWISMAIGLGLAITFIPLALNPSILIRAFKKLGRLGEGPAFSTTSLLGLFFGSTLASVALTHILVPDFPVWILILFSVGWSFFASFLSASATGYSGGFSIPRLTESVIYFSGYRGIDIWYANFITWGGSVPTTVGLPLIATGGGSISGQFKMADMVGCRIREFIFALVLVTILGWIMSFLFSSLFWWAAPIPSSAYPYTVTGWIVEVMERNRMVNWLWTGILFKTDVILEGFGVGAILSFISHFLHLPFLPVAVAGGILVSIDAVTAQFIGGLISQFLIAPRIGKERWRMCAPLVWTGIFIGDAAVGTLTSAISLVSKAQWIIPY